MNSLKDFENQVKNLIAEQNWNEAYKLCNQILGYDPENSTFIKLRNKIENEVKLLNKRAIGHELKKLEELIKEKKYEEYLKAIAPLQTYVNIYPEIGEKILNAKKLLDLDYQNRKNQAILDIEKEIKSSGEQLDYLITIQKLDQLAKLKYKTEKIFSLQKLVKQKYISKELKANENLINSQKFEDIIIFLLKLQKIDQSNGQIQNLINKVKNRYQNQKVENKKDYIFKTTEEIKTLYITKKFDKCIELTERILEIDPKNILALKYGQKAKIKANKLSEKLIVKQILENYKKFPTTKEYKNKNFIRI